MAGVGEAVVGIGDVGSGMVLVGIGEVGAWVVEGTG